MCSTAQVNYFFTQVGAPHRTRHTLHAQQYQSCERALPPHAPPTAVTSVGAVCRDASALMPRPLPCGAPQEHDPPRLCALDLPGEHAEGDDLGEPDAFYFSEHPDELEARPARPARPQQGQRPG